MTFAKKTIEAAGLSMPSGFIPSPWDWIEDVQDRYPDLGYVKGGSVSVDHINGEEKHVPEWSNQKSWAKATWEGDSVTKRQTATGK